VALVLKTVVTSFAYVALAWVTHAASFDQFFSINDAKATMTVDHSEWGRILGRYVKSSPDGINRFAYGRVSEADKRALKAYLGDLQQVKVTALKPDEQRAYWINFYNALTIDVVLDHYPVKSIRDIGGGLFAAGPWRKPLVSVQGRRLSLDNIEHDILRKVWRDARVHYAVNCASLSCPNLMGEPFTAAKLEAMLNKGARDYANHPRGASVKDGKLVLSRIYSWYRRDFGTSDAEIIEHVASYAEPKLKKQLAGIETIDDYFYDWSLNEAK
jgi:hypothetical protein